MHNKYFDQLEFTGHYDRKNDIENIAELGIKAMRYPVLWEKYQPAIRGEIDFDFPKQNLYKLIALNVKPIVGLVHHGSGPAFVNFFDGSFEDGLAEYACRIASEFPWVEFYTPVPLTKMQAISERYVGNFNYN